MRTGVRWSSPNDSWYNSVPMYIKPTCFLCAMWLLNFVLVWDQIYYRWQHRFSFSVNYRWQHHLSPNSPGGSSFHCRHGGACSVAMADVLSIVAASCLHHCLWWHCSVCGTPSFSVPFDNNHLFGVHSSTDSGSWLQTSGKVVPAWHDG